MVFISYRTSVKSSQGIRARRGCWFSPKMGLFLKGRRFGGGNATDWHYPFTNTYKARYSYMYTFVSFNL